MEFTTDTDHSFAASAFVEALEKILLKAQCLESALQHLLDSFHIHNLPPKDQAHAFFLIADHCKRIDLAIARRFIERAVLTYPIETHRDPLAISIMHTFAIIMGKSGFFGDSRRALAKAFHCAARINDVRHLVALSLSLSTLYSLNELLDKALQVLHFGEMILALFKTEFDDLTFADYRNRIISNRLSIYGKQGNLSKALYELLQLEPDRILNPSIRGLTLMRTGILWEQLGDLEEAYKAYRRAWKTLQENTTPDLSAELHVLINLSTVSLQLRDYQASATYSRQAYQHAQQLRSSVYLIPALSNFTRALIAQNAKDQLPELIETLLTEHQRASFWKHRAELAFDLANCYVALEEHNQAYQYASTAYALAQQKADQPLLVEYALLLAMLSVQLQRRDEAEQWLQRAQNAFSSELPDHLRMEFFHTHAQFYQAIQDWERAYHWLERYHQEHTAVLQAQLKKQKELLERKQQIQHEQLQTQHQQQIAELHHRTLQLLTGHLKPSLDNALSTLQLLDANHPLSHPYNQDMLAIIEHELHNTAEHAEQYSTELKSALVELSRQNPLLLSFLIDSTAPDSQQS